MPNLREIHDEICLLSQEQKQKNSELLHRRLDQALEALETIQEKGGILRPGNRRDYATNDQELLIFRFLQDISCALTGEHWRPIQK